MVRKNSTAEEVMYQRDIRRLARCITIRTTMVVISSLCLFVPAGGILESQVANATPGPGGAWTGHKAAVPEGAASLGAVATQKTLQLDVVLKPSNAVALAAYASAVATPGSPDYHHYLSPAQFATQFGATLETVETVEASLRAEQLTVSGISANRLTVYVTGTASTIEQAFATPIVSYRLSDGATGFVNSAAPRFSGAGAAQVSGVLGLDSLPAASAQITLAHRAQLTSAASEPLPHLTSHLAGPQPSSACGSAILSASSSYPGSLLYSYNEIADAYGYNNLYGAGDLGQGTTVALIEFAPYVSSDITSFEDCYSTPPTPTITNVPVDGGAGTPGTYGPGVNEGGEEEAELDIEAFTSLAPDAAIDVYEGPQAATDSDILDTYTAAIDNPAVNVISTSWGDCEADIDSNLYNGESILFEQAATEGKTVVAAAGDDGSEDCYGTLRGPAGDALAVDDPASQPYVTGIGGTYLSAIGPPPTESVWNNNEDDGGAGGGGVSSIWPMPTYQSDAPASLGVVTANSVCSSGSGDCREVPDVSANSGVAVAMYCTEAGNEGCASGGWTGVGGTSVAAPTWAALFALADASSACDGTPIGFANPALYEVAGGSGYSSAFTDITTGDNDLLGAHGGLYPATPGYDLASGLGSPIAGSGSDDGLVSQLCTIVHSPPKTSSALTTGGTGAVLSRLSPSAGPNKGGTRVTIRGSGFTGTSAVDFGRTKATSFTIDSKTKIVAVAPTNSGTVFVTVTTPDGKTKRVAVAKFTYLAVPLLKRLSPSVGTTAGKTTVTLVGSGFVDVTAVDFGRRKATSFTIDSKTKIVAVAPANSGTVFVAVTTPGGTSIKTRPDEFSYR
jgi:subtilase family serine protease